MGEYYRMNMPFELGVDYGCRLVGRAPLKAKRFLVLEKDQHEFKKALSDLSGVDIKSHNNEPERLVRAVRDWFVETVRLRNAPAPSVLWYSFTDFASDFYDKRLAAGHTGDDLNMMPILEYIDAIRDWLAAR